MRGAPAKAEECFRRALALRETQAPWSPERAATLNNLGILAWIGGDPAKASGIYTQALAIVRKRAPGSVGEAQVLNNLGIVERRWGGWTRPRGTTRPPTASRSPAIRRE
jgi:Tfp pilus assembly protein PilF